jgi:hypothetical protein
MNQVGQLKTFRVMGTPPAYPVPIYVYKFWDGSVIATGTYAGSVQKRLNLGGNPAESFTVPYRCDICDNLGNVVQVVTSSIQVNNPPTIVPSPTVVPNDHAFPYPVTISVRGYDLEDNGVAFFWYHGTNPIGGKDSTANTPAGVAGTYYGTLIGANKTLYTNTFQDTVVENGTVLTCKLVDGDSGTSTINFELRGYDPSAPQFSVAASPDTVTSGASTLPVQVIAPNQTVKFTAFGYDPTPGSLLFTWYFYGSNGWSQPGLPVITTDTGTAVSQGLKSEKDLPIATEVTAGQKTAVVSVTNTVTGKTSYSSIPVRLILNEGPTITSIGLYDATTGQPVTTITKLASPLRTLVRFSGTASDSNEDVLSFRWDINSPPASAAYTVYGREGYVDVTDWTSPATYTNVGALTATDRYGVVSSTFSMPQITIA